MKSLRLSVLDPPAVCLNHVEDALLVSLPYPHQFPNCYRLLAQRQRGLIDPKQ